MWTESSNTIFHQLIFTNESYDVFDSPFIKINNNNFAIFPLTTTLLEPASAFISNIAKSKYSSNSLSFKGGNFARLFLELVNKAGIPCYPLSAKKKQDNDCDAVFILDNVLFIIECKTIMQPHQFSRHASVKEKLVKATRQLNKNANLLIQNIDKIRMKFNLRFNWAPNNVYKVVLTDVKIGKAMLINNCYISDISILSLFFTKKGIGLRLEGKPIESSYTESLEITAKNLLSELSTPRTLKEFEKSVGTMDTTFKLEHHKIHAEFYTEKNPSNYFLIVKDDLYNS